MPYIAISSKVKKRRLAMNKRIFKLGFLILFTTFFYCLLVNAQVTTTGKIVGKVVDKTSGEPLIGATVTLDRLRLGSATDINGEYMILNVPVGTYKFTARFIGYRDMVVKDVRVNAGFTTTQDVQLSSEAVELGEIVVEASRPLIKKDKTNSTTITTAEEIKNLPLRGIQGVVSVQTGFVSGRGTDENTFYTRGGRSDETVLYVDGFEQNNLLTGQATTSFNQNAIEEIQTQSGGFNAEYGRALSGVINVVTKEAAPKYTVQLESESDFFMGEKYSRGYNIYNLSLSGPVIPGQDWLTLFISGELKNFATNKATSADIGRVFRGGKFENWNKGYLPNDRNDGYTIQSKLVFRFSPEAKFNVNLLTSKFTTQNYFDIYKYNLDHSPWSEDQNLTVSGTFTYTIDKSTFMEVGLAYFSTKRWDGDGVYRKNFDSYTLAGGDNPRNLYDPARGGFFTVDGWDKYQGNQADTAGMAAFVAANNLSPYLVAADRYDPYGLYFAPGYARRYYRTYEATYINPKINIVSQIHKYHQIKLGFEYRYHSLSSYETFTANRGINGTPLNAYGYTLDARKDKNGNGGYLDAQKHPYDIAVYAQDKIEQEGLIVNAGIRFDFFNANTNALKDERDPLGANQVPSGDPRQRLVDAGDFSKTKTESQVSPRLGLAFPITDKTVFHFNYGKFFQQSELNDLYYGTKFIEFKATNGSPAISTQNPNLKPEQTTAYEIGIDHEIADNIRFSASAYYKDTKNLVNVVYTPTSSPVGAALYLLSNLDYGTIKGFDFSLEARRIGMISGRLSYSLAYAEGTGSASRENFNAAWLGFSTAKFTQPLAFDQRHTFSANVDIRNSKGEGSKILENAGVNILFLVRSGFPYTPTAKYNSGAANISASVPKDAPLDGVNTRYGPWTSRIDLKLDKEIDWGIFKTDIYLRVLNLLDTKNILAVFQATGDGYSDGYLGSNLGVDQKNQYNSDTKTYTTAADFVSKYQDRLNGADLSTGGASSRKFDTPREVRLGIILNF
jgi:outer membrane receptor protein involved in Fe transport